MSGKVNFELFVVFGSEASRRNRFIIIFLVIICTLDFSTYWNSRPGSWLNSQIQLHECMLRNLPAWLPFSDKRLQAITDPLERRAFESARALASRRGLQLEARDPMQKQALRGDLVFRDTSLTMRATRFEKFLQERLTKYERRYEDAVPLVSVPLLNVTFHVNDAGMLGGFAFVVVLLVFSFSLEREMRNLRTLLNMAGSIKENYLRTEALELITVNQVLTIVPNRFPLMPPVWDKLPKLLLVLPIIVQTLVVTNDVQTFQRGWISSPFNTVVTMSFSVLFLIFILLLCWHCYRSWRHMDEMLQHEYNEHNKRMQRRR